MKLVKSLLLGSVAGFAAVASAQAADLPVKKNVEYVKVCSTYGAGFFYIPGTDTCLKIGGRVRAEVQYKDWDADRGQSMAGVADWGDHNRDNVGWRTRAQIALDSRTATEYGTLRTFIRFQMTHNSGSPYGSFHEDSRDPTLDRAFVQFLGLTAGRSVSFFDFSEGTNYGTLRFSDGVVTNLLAYTATFGDGMSFTLALEDQAERRVGGYSTVTNNPFADQWFDAVTWAPIFGDVVIGDDERGGSKVPDIVAAFRVDQSWGSAQLSAAAHQTVGDDRFANGNGDEWGYAVGLGVKLNLDMLAPGDYFWANATYTKGALGYMGFDNNGNNRAGGGLGRNSRLADAIGYDTGLGHWDAELAEGWQVSAGIQHYWTPTFRSSIFGSYAQVDAIDIAYSNGVNWTGGYSATPEMTEYRIGIQNVWSPVRNLDIGLEVLYANAEYDYNVWENTAGVSTSPATYNHSWTEEEKSWEARLRIQRDF